VGIVEGVGVIVGVGEPGIVVVVPIAGGVEFVGIFSTVLQAAIMRQSR
jgi:hypothetical protein